MSGATTHDEHHEDLHLAEYLRMATLRYRDEEANRERNRLFALRLYLANAPSFAPHPLAANPLAVEPEAVMSIVRQDLDRLLQDYLAHVEEES